MLSGANKKKHRGGGTVRIIKAGKTVRKRMAKLNRGDDVIGQKRGQTEHERVFRVRIEEAVGGRRGERRGGGGDEWANGSRCSHRWRNAPETAGNGALFPGRR